MPWPEILAAALAAGCRSTRVSVCPRGSSWPNAALPAPAPGRPACMCAGSGRLSFSVRRFKAKQRQQDAHGDPSTAQPDASRKALGKLQRSRTMTHHKLVTFSKKSL